MNIQAARGVFNQSTIGRLSVSDGICRVICRAYTLDRPRRRRRPTQLVAQSEVIPTRRV